MQKALAADPENIRYMSGMSEIYYAEKNLDAAIRQIKQILKVRPSDVKYLIALATLYEEANDKEKAQLYYRRAHSLDPYNEFVKKKLT